MSVTPPGIAATRPSAIRRVHRGGGQPVRLGGLQVQDLSQAGGNSATLRRCRGRDRRAASPCPVNPWSGLVHELAPQVGTHVLRRAGIPDPRRDPMLHVIMPEGDVDSTRARSPRRMPRERPAVLDPGPIEGEDPFHLTVQHHHLIALWAPSGRSSGARDRATYQRLMRHRENGRDRAAGYTNRRGLSPRRRPPPSSSNRRRIVPGLGGARGIVVAGDEDDRRVRAAPRGAAETGGRRRRSPRWWDGRSGRGHRR